MTPAPRSRRAFLGQTLAAAGATALLPPPLRAAPAPDWTIGCLNRPWTKWSCDAMLDGVKAAGFTEVGL
ncbi:MAG: twin-arginine translocation signal domain-containing protein, partial [Verrucomicrobia bacterium]|nr:twin-arginine translocation signal domain-containing protein [Verrucomicrobiota bacterium]